MKAPTGIELTLSLRFVGRVTERSEHGRGGEAREVGASWPSGGYTTALALRDSALPVNGREKSDQTLSGIRMYWTKPSAGSRTRAGSFGPPNRSSAVSPEIWSVMSSRKRALKESSKASPS